MCDKEADLAIEASEAQEQSRSPERTSRLYAQGALQYLAPTLTQCSTKQKEFDDDDEWNPCKATGICLMLIAQCHEDNIVPHILLACQRTLQEPRLALPQHSGHVL